MSPATGTVAILAGLIVWNDFFTPLIFLNGSDSQTLPVVMYNYVGALVSQWNMIFAIVLISMVPILAFYIVRPEEVHPGLLRRSQELGATVRALVVGAGPAGCTASIALARQGADVLLIEIEPAPRPLGVGLLLQNSPLRALDSLGLVGPCVARGYVHGEIDLCDQSGRVLTRIAPPSLVEGQPATVAIFRAALAEVLLRRWPRPALNCVWPPPFSSSTIAATGCEPLYPTALSRTSTWS